MTKTESTRTLNIENKQDWKSYQDSDQEHTPLVGHIFRGEKVRVRIGEDNIFDVDGRITVVQHGN